MGHLRSVGHDRTYPLGKPVTKLPAQVLACVRRGRLVSPRHATVPIAALTDVPRPAMVLLDGRQTEGQQSGPPSSTAGSRNYSVSGGFCPDRSGVIAGPNSPWSRRRAGRPMTRSLGAAWTGSATWRWSVAGMPACPPGSPGWFAETAPMRPSGSAGGGDTHGGTPAQVGAAAPMVIGLSAWILPAQHIPPWTPQAIGGTRRLDTTGGPVSTDPDRGGAVERCSGQGRSEESAADVGGRARASRPATRPRTVPNHRSAKAFAPWRLDRSEDEVDALACEDRSEAGGVLRVPIADQEPEGAAVGEVEGQVPGLLDRPQAMVHAQARCSRGLAAGIGST
jgi:hypothetical protein